MLLIMEIAHKIVNRREEEMLGAWMYQKMEMKRIIRSFSRRCNNVSAPLKQMEAKTKVESITSMKTKENRK